MKPLSIVILSALTLTTTACATATAGLSKNDGRSVVRSFNDSSAVRTIRARMLREPGYNLGGVTVEAGQGVVLLKGNVPTPEDRIEAERIAWSAPNIEQVGNEIFIDGKKGIVTGTKDSYLNTAVRSRLTADKYVKGTNVNIETYDGIVYLLGVARTPEELDRIARIASETKGTREVISYLKLAKNYQPPNQSYAQAPSAQVSSHSGPQIMPQSAPHAAPSYRPLPEGLTAAPQPAPNNISPDMSPGLSAENEPYYVDPKTGKRITLAPGTLTIPHSPSAKNGDGGAEPFYINPDTGQQIKVVYRITRPVQ